MNKPMNSWSGKGYLFLFTLLAIFMFVPLFVIKTIGGFDFWWWMSTNMAVLIGLAFLIERNYWHIFSEDIRTDVIRKLITGILSAVILYAVFFIGDILSRHLFGFAGREIGNIYAFKGGAAPLRIIVLIVLIIGPGEELLWRGFLQRNLSVKFGKMIGFNLSVVIYTGVHLTSGNIMLVMAALVCGIFWGWLYLRYQSMVINIISHTLWDLAVFIMVPFS
jgi:membrane protease YdiL (CAAX protease family)